MKSTKRFYFFVVLVVLVLTLNVCGCSQSQTSKSASDKTTTFDSNSTVNIANNIIVSNDIWTVKLISLNYFVNSDSYSLDIEINNNASEVQEYICSIINIKDSSPGCFSSVTLSPNQKSIVNLLFSSEELQTFETNDSNVVTISIEAIHENLPAHPTLEYTFELSCF